MRLGRIFLVVLLLSCLLGISVGIVMQTALHVPIDESVVMIKHVSLFTKGIHDHKFALLNRKPESAKNTDGKYKVDGTDVRFVLSKPEMEAKYGSGANLTPDETRDLYHKVLEDTEAAQNKWVSIPHRDASPSGVDAEEHEAIMCSIARGRVRQYARSRMADQRSAHLLNVRDAWTHGLKYLPQAMWADAKSAVTNWIAGRGFVVGLRPTREELMGVKEEGIVDSDEDSDWEAEARRDTIEPRFSQTSATLASASNCLTGSEEGQCPGIHFSRFVRGKSNKQMRDSCYRTSSHYDKLYGTRGAKRGAAADPPLPAAASADADPLPAAAAASDDAEL